MTLAVDAHPLLHLAAFETTLAAPLGETPSPAWLTALLALDAEAPVQRSETIRATSRNLLRYGGYKPTGRGKPASEYLVRAAENGKLGSINAVVDACNVVSLHSGLPISVVDLDRATAPFRVGLAEPGASYVFNTGGQTIDLGGLLCLFDSEGPCANGVKDSQRTKTHDGTRRTLSLVWGHQDLAAQVETATAWYRSLLEQLGAETQAAVLP
ncbi:MAG: phenylalanine--tRNA ligase beta subunit-related protein [Bacteroidota bacterium]